MQAGENIEASELGQEVCSIVDFPQIASNLGNSSQAETLSLLKTAVSNIDEGLKQHYQETSDANVAVFGRACLIDRLINIIYDKLFSGVNQKVSLIAVGGYGRGELHPKSDIDMMLLLDEAENENTRAIIEQFLMLLWDIKLEIGHSVRTVNECIDEASNDITIATNLMESRLLAGDESLFTRMKTETGPDYIWDSKSFFQAKSEEQIQRNGKFNDTAYNLEPNIKESSGGLRDIQMIGWVAKRHFNASSLYDLVDKGFLLNEEYKTLMEGQYLLWRIRCSLHYLAGRREDRLLFDYQRDLALEFGFSDDAGRPNNEAIEQFMQQYYRTVIGLERLNEMLLQHFREAIIYADENPEAEIIDKAFRVRNGYLETQHNKIFEEDPHNILKLFLVLQDYPEIRGVRAQTIREIRQYRHLIDDDIRNSPRAHKLFFDILSRTHGVTQQLRRMNRYGILAAYIPAFDSIVGRMQYDLFHAYTVDQHTLFVIRNMRRFSVPDFCHEFPLASGIFQHLPNPTLLYLAGLFHDIAKGRPGDHSTLGAVDAKVFCDLHGLDEKDSDLVSWLVKSHLIMSLTAQRKDISDPVVISEFAEQTGTIERLDYLYLLTISDIRGTNPKQWNNWKDNLFSELYNKTASYLNSQSSKHGRDFYAQRDSHVNKKQTDSMRHLQRAGIDSHIINKLWDTFSDEYFLGHSTNEIVWHTALIIYAQTHDELDQPLISTRVDQSGNSIELLIYMQDRPHIFYSIVNVLSNSEVDIVNSQIMNTSDNYALETFRLIPVNISKTELEVVSELIDRQLNENLASKKDITPSTLDRERRHKFFSSPTKIKFKAPVSPTTTEVTIETMDRPGVLANIAMVLSENDLQIISAHIANAGEKAIDRFTISTNDEKALTEEQKEVLQQQLTELL